MRKHIRDNAYTAAKLFLALYICFSIISYVYTLYNDTYNGDYLGVRPVLSEQQLFFNLIYTIIPYFVLFFIYKQYKNKPSKGHLAIPIKGLGVFVFSIVILNIIVTLLFGVGKAGQEVYQAPTVIKLFIQILLRFSASFGAFLYIIVSDKKGGFHGLLIILLIILSLLRFSLGILPTLATFALLKYYDELFRFIKKWAILVIIMLMLFPVIVQYLYTYRDAIRVGDKVTNVEKTVVTKIIFGKLIGRLSAFSNTAIIMERERTMNRFISEFSIFEYYKDAFRAIHSGFESKNEVSYKNILQRSQGLILSNSSFMLGTNGVLTISLYQSILVFILNMALMVILCSLTFKIGTILKYDKIPEYLFLRLLMPVMGGMGNEYMASLIGTLLFIIIILFLALFKKYS